MWSISQTVSQPTSHPALLSSQQSLGGVEMPLLDQHQLSTFWFSGPKNAQQRVRITSSTTDPSGFIRKKSLARFTDFTLYCSVTVLHRPTLFYTSPPLPIRGPRNMCGSLKRCYHIPDHTAHVHALSRRVYRILGKSQMRFLIQQNACMRY